MIDLSPFETLFDATTGRAFPLAGELARMYGELRFTGRPGGPWVVANAVSTVDGIVALGDGGPSGGAEISGGSAHDRLLMGMLRAAADVVVVGAGTVRASPRHTWTPESVFRSLGDEFHRLRQALGKPLHPGVAIVSANGNLDPDLALLSGDPDRVVILTTPRGRQQLADRPRAWRTAVVDVGQGEVLPATGIVRAIQDWRRSDLVLVEGGPHLLGQFVDDRVLDELFLTVSPQIGGRDATVARLGLVEGKRFGPADPRWAVLAAVKRAESHLFLRYVFERSPIGGTQHPNGRVGV